MNSPTVLDPCCGSRMMWFDTQDQRCLFGQRMGKQNRTHWMQFMKEPE